MVTWPLLTTADVKTGDPTTYALVQAFEQKYPNIKVNLSGQPVAQHDQTIDVGAQSHTLPDIFWVQSADTGAKLAQSGAQTPRKRRC